MPELPEVETVRNSLKEIILNKRIKDIIVRYDKIIENVSVDDFINKLKEQEIIDIKRKGKYLIFELNDYYLVSHLRMEGKFFDYTGLDYGKHDHIIFIFDDFNLRYNDTRKFGRMDLFEKSVDIYKCKPLAYVGPDANCDEASVDYLVSKFKKINKPIKETLLDQSIMSGLGNIYVDEVLFMARLHPESKTCNLDLDDIKNIKDASTTVLNKAITMGGTTIKSFAASHNHTGLFQNELLVHTKEICPICKSKIEKIRVGGRGTYFCPNCQKIK